MEVKPVSTPTPVPVEEPLGSYMVKPYLVYPADKTMYPEYETAVKNYLIEMQSWYKQKVGVSFNMAPLKVVRSSENYLTIRCGLTPSQACLNDSSKLDGNVGMYMNKAIHNGVEQWEEKTAALIFAAGAGGYAGSNKYPNDTGWAIVGDWVLEPISGVASSWGIPCKYSNGWQCTGGVPKGTPAHELGHAFGLPHPGDQYKDQSIMQWHGGYPSVGFLPSEVEQLKASPFFKNETVSPTPATVFSCDANKDGVKDAKDGEFVKSCWNKPATGTCAMVDVNGDKTISILDVQKFSGNCPETFSSTCQPRPDCLDARPACAIAEPAGGWCTPTLSPTPAPVQKGDGNKDGKINLIDMSVIHTDWMKDQTKVSNFRDGIDMNGDGLINTFDYAMHRKVLLELGVIKGH
ncbi:dockerin type I domain-containing protein [Patescibacteria group bacterium]|nr:dockerin type I domain-containing protein [Patescibacteria group bacterium]